MNAQDYYARNVLLHGLEPPTVTKQDFHRLPTAPSEMEYTLFWLAQEGIRGSILDVGCAGLSLLLNAGDQFTHRHGVDIVPLPIWKQRPEIRTQTCNLDETDLPFEAGAFDAVTCLMVVEHVFDPFHAVRELRRVCLPEGRVIIGVPNLAGIKRRIELFLGRLPITSARFAFGEDSWDGYHLHNFTQASLNWLLRKEGLEPIRWAAQGKAQVLKRWRPSLFGNDLIVMARVSRPRPDLPFCP